MALTRGDGQAAIEFDAQSGATSGLDLSDGVVGGHGPEKAVVVVLWTDRRSFVVSQRFATCLTTGAFTHR
jgi:hypothetical protein